MCADAKSVFPTWQNKKIKKQWVDSVELFLAETPEGEIICTQVSFYEDENKTAYMMDCVTGTLYRENGSCLTSDYLKIFNLRAEQNLGQKLLSIRQHKLVGG